MKLNERARAVWRNWEAWAYALDYDSYADMASRFERLERDGQSRQAELTALSGEVLKLSRQPRRVSPRAR